MDCRDLDDEELSIGGGSLGTSNRGCCCCSLVTDVDACCLVDDLEVDVDEDDRFDDFLG